MIAPKFIAQDMPDWGPDLVPAQYCQAATSAASGAAYYADDLDRYVAIFQPWMEVPPQRDTLLMRVHNKIKRSEGTSH